MTSPKTIVLKVRHTVSNVNDVVPPINYYVNLDDIHAQLVEFMMDSSLNDMSNIKFENNSLYIFNGGWIIVSCDDTNFKTYARHAVCEVMASLRENNNNRLHKEHREKAITMFGRDDTAELFGDC